MLMSKNLWRVFAGILPALFLALPAEAAHPAPDPWLKSVVEQGKELGQADQSLDEAGKAKWDKDVKALIESTLHWPALTQATMGRRWKKLSSKQQREFSALLREMIEASYQSKLRLGRDKKDRPKKVNIKWEKAKVRGDEATAEAKVKSGRRKLYFAFELLWDKTQWRVVDVSVDEVSTVKTYRSQFRKIITKEGYAALIQRMRKKTQEIRDGLNDLNQTSKEAG